ncbi:MAG: peptidoglycan DD-metalloendopeptidase family protein [Cyanobacteria bacterium J06635_15]
MRRRIPERYTVLIARTGKTPLTLSFKPITAVILLAIAIGGPLIWGGFTITALIRSNSQLSERNQELTNTANEVLLELDSLDAEVEDLQERAGLEEGVIPESQPQQQSSQGGIGQTVDPETLFQLAQQRLPNLKGRLNGRVKPALEETLAQEQARASAYPSAIPLKGSFEVSSEFGVRRNPFGGFSFESHEGIDFLSAYGAPIYATAEGRVTLAENSNGYGNHVIIDHGYRHETLYAHMSELVVKVGDRVNRGQIVGYLGNTGRSSGPHLHYGVYRNGKAVNPRYYLKLEE